MSAVSPAFLALGESALLVRFADRMDPHAWRRVQALYRKLAQRPLPGQVELLPAYASLGIYFDPLQTSRPAVEQGVRERMAAVREDAPLSGREVVIPVCYGGEFGPDLEAVADVHGLTPAEVVALHAGAEYTVYMIGFTPGFPYLGGLPPELATPRRETPRTRVPAGSVGIAGDQTGVYPFDSPGGWQIIGRTPLKLFQPDRDPPSLLAPGDRVRFAPISPEAWERWPEGGGRG